MHILIPMAGAASRFVKEGYKDSKPLIDVFGLPMIIRVIDNLPASNDYTFITRKDFHDGLRLKSLLSSLKPNSNIIEIDCLTNGAAETCLLAKQFINTEDSLLIANCDQIQEWNTNLFINYTCNTTYDGTIITFKSNSSSNSYVELKNGLVVRCAEKIVISDTATTGIYYWRKGLDFVRYTEQMITKNIRTNNEFYVCPVYNELIASGGKVSTYQIERHHPIGTPNDLQRYLACK
jgi:dTDP-glucose pyrophosphorylase